MYGYKCAICKCSLDPGEGRVCDDCSRKKNQQSQEQPEKIQYIRQEGQKCYVG